jgi:2-iminobutanoate/2-iminopropanoate deaminase
MREFLGKFVALCFAAAALAGCGSVSDRMWVRQAPGNIADDGMRENAARPAPTPQVAAARVEAPAARAPAPAASAPVPAARVAVSSTPVANAEATAPGAYTQVTRYGDLYFLSGQIGIDLTTGRWDPSANAEQQTRAAMDNVRRVLEGERLTMANVVSVTVYLRSMVDYRAMNDAYESYFRSALPARTVVEVARLPRDALVEITVTAGR